MLCYSPLVGKIDGIQARHISSKLLIKLRHDDLSLVIVDNELGAVGTGKERRSAGEMWHVSTGQASVAGWG